MRRHGRVLHVNAFRERDFLGRESGNGVGEGGGGRGGDVFPSVSSVAIARNSAARLTRQEITSRERLDALDLE